MIGDSTYDVHAPGFYLDAALKALMEPEQPLEGMQSTNLLNYGYNGADTAAATDSQHMSVLASSAPDVVLASFGINDVRAQTLDFATLRVVLSAGIERIRAALPGIPVIVSIPNSFLTTDVDGHQYVSPADQAQAKSTLLRQAYLSLAGSWPDVYINDNQEFVFGITSQTVSSLMSDQIHPSSTGSQLVAARLGALLAG